MTSASTTGAPPFRARHGGFDVHVAVRIAANDDEGREHLVRYCARPLFALERTEELRDGLVVYRMNRLVSGARTAG